jgi:hypothetical protein
MTSRLILLGALLLPVAAAAQPADPNVPPPPPTDPVPAQPAPAPGQQPVTNQPTVVVNPPAPQPAPPPVTVEANTAPAPVVQPEYEVIEDTYNAPMFTSGALVFGLAYGASVISAAASDDERGNHRLYVPLAGPWLALSDRGSCDISRSSCDHETTVKVLLIADGIFQAAGVLAMLDGVFQPTTHRVVRHTAKLDTKLHLTPATVHGDPGVAVFGRF